MQKEQVINLKYTFMKKNKVLKVLTGGLIAASCAYVGFLSYDKTSSTTESDLLLANIEALSETESSSTGYIVHHMACVDVNKVPTGKYLAYCYSGGSKSKHEHSCIYCSSI